MLWMLKLAIASRCSLSRDRLSRELVRHGYSELPFEQDAAHYAHFKLVDSYTSDVKILVLSRDDSCHEIMHG